MEVHKEMMTLPIVDKMESVAFPAARDRCLSADVIRSQLETTYKHATVTYLKYLIHYLESRKCEVC